MSRRSPVVLLFLRLVTLYRTGTCRITRRGWRRVRPFTRELDDPMIKTRRRQSTPWSRLRPTRMKLRSGRVTLCSLKWVTFTRTCSTSTFLILTLLVRACRLIVLVELLYWVAWRYLLGTPFGKCSRTRRTLKEEETRRRNRWEKVKIGERNLRYPVKRIEVKSWTVKRRTVRRRRQTSSWRRT